MTKFLIAILILISSVSYSQNVLVGNWKIDKILGANEAKDYVITPQEEISYGNNLIVNKDGTFESSYSAPCGNDTFTTTIGTYEIIGNNTVKFILRELHVVGIGVEKEDLIMNKEIGVFNIVKTDKTITLIKVN